MQLNKEVKCKDGVTLSVQASSYHYCSPREDVGPYSHVEVGFPSIRPVGFIKYAEDKNDLTGSVYPYVPVKNVKLFIKQHGGMVSGELPEMVK